MDKACSQTFGGSSEIQGKLNKPRQKTGMSVNDYIDQFTDWKKRMEADMFSSDELSYVEDFNSGLDCSICIRVRTSLLKPINLSTAYSIARIEEAMMSIESFWGTEHMKAEAHNLFDKTPTPESAALIEDQLALVVSNEESREENREEANNMFDEMPTPIPAAIIEEQHIPIDVDREHYDDLYGEEGQFLSGDPKLKCDSMMILEEVNVKNDGINSLLEDGIYLVVRDAHYSLFESKYANEIEIMCIDHGNISFEHKCFWKTFDNAWILESHLSSIVTVSHDCGMVYTYGNDNMFLCDCVHGTLSVTHSSLDEGNLPIFDPGGSFNNDEGMDVISQMEGVKLSKELGYDLLRHVYSFLEYMDSCLASSHLLFWWKLFIQIKQVMLQNFKNIYVTVVEIYGFRFLFAEPAAVLSELGSQFCMVIIVVERYTQAASFRGIIWVPTMFLLVNEAHQHYFGGCMSEEIRIYVDTPVVRIYTFTESNALLRKHFLLLSVAALVEKTVSHMPLISWIVGFLYAAYILFDAEFYFLFDPGGYVNLNVHQILGFFVFHLALVGGRCEYEHFFLGSGKNSVAEIFPEVILLLDEFSKVCSAPIHLPPKQKTLHSIDLKDGAISCSTVKNLEESLYVTYKGIRKIKHIPLKFLLYKDSAAGNKSALEAIPQDAMSSLVYLARKQGKRSWWWSKRNNILRWHPIIQAQVVGISIMIKLKAGEVISYVSTPHACFSCMSETMVFDNFCSLTYISLYLPCLKSIRLAHCHKFKFNLQGGRLSSMPPSLVLQKEGILTKLGIQFQCLHKVYLTDCGVLCIVVSNDGGCPVIKSLILLKYGSLTTLEIVNSFLMNSSVGCHAITFLVLRCHFLEEISLYGCAHLERGSFCPVAIRFLNMGISLKQDIIAIEAHRLTHSKLKGCGQLSRISVNCAQFTPLEFSYGTTCKLAIEELSYLCTHLMQINLMGVVCVHGTGFSSGLGSRDSLCTFLIDRWLIILPKAGFQLLASIQPLQYSDNHRTCGRALVS